MIETKITCLKCGYSLEGGGRHDDGDTYFIIDIPFGWRIIENRLLCQSCVKEFRRYTKSFWLEKATKSVFGFKNKNK